VVNTNILFYIQLYVNPIVLFCFHANRLSCYFALVLNTKKLLSTVGLVLSCFFARVTSCSGRHFGLTTLTCIGGLPDLLFAWYYWPGSGLPWPACLCRDTD